MDNTHNNNNMSSKQIPSEGEQPIGVQLSVAPGSSSSVNGKDHSIFVGGLSIDTTNASLSAYFSKFGKVENCKVVRHVKNKHSRCFGFVTFVCTQAAAIISGGPHTIDGKVVDVKQMENQQPKNKLGNKRTRKNIQSRGESKVKGIKQEFSKKEVDEKRGTNKKKDQSNIQYEQVQNTSDIPSEGEQQLQLIGNLNKMMPKTAPGGDKSTLITLTDEQIVNSTVNRMVALVTRNLMFPELPNLSNKQKLEIKHLTEKPIYIQSDGQNKQLHPSKIPSEGEQQLQLIGNLNKMMPKTAPGDDKSTLIALTDEQIVNSTVNRMVALVTRNLMFPELPNLSNKQKLEIKHLTEKPIYIQSDGQNKQLHPSKIPSEGEQQLQLICNLNKMMPKTAPGGDKSTLIALTDEQIVNSTVNRMVALVTRNLMFPELPNVSNKLPFENYTTMEGCSAPKRSRQSIGIKTTPDHQNEHVHVYSKPQNRIQFSQGNFLFSPDTILEFVDPDEISLEQYIKSDDLKRCSVPKPEGMDLWERDSECGSPKR
ncbi:hypothetical protein niasHS_005156 [Heterodera schachtii]|uniref:RRM domain-containing protein n=1 Tax=Heterodera schachtii TaxID=97005 RepID=A0ABD2JRL4_HETSC